MEEIKEETETSPLEEKKKELEAEGWKLVTYYGNGPVYKKEGQYKMIRDNGSTLDY